METNPSSLGRQFLPNSPPNLIHNDELSGRSSDRRFLYVHGKANPA